MGVELTGDRFHRRSLDGQKKRKKRVLWAGAFVVGLSLLICLFIFSSKTIPPAEESTRSIQEFAKEPQFQIIEGEVKAKSSLAKSLSEKKVPLRWIHVIISKLEPDEVLFHANLGTVYYHQGAYPEAIREYKQALKVNPLYGMGFSNLSYVYGVLRRTSEALRYMEKAVHLNPLYADLHYNLALFYSDRGRNEKAISELKKALRINPNYLFARINLGVLYEDQKRWKEARKEYQKVLQITPEDEQLRRRLERIS